PPDQSPTFAQGISRAFAAATGTYVAVQDSDDVSRQDRLRQQVDFLDANPNVGLVGAWVDLIDASGRTIGQMHPPQSLSALRDAYAVGNPIGHAVVMWRHRMAVAVGGYGQGYVNSCDYALALSLLEAGYDSAVIPQTLASIRLHSGQTTRSRETLAAR